MLWVNDFISRFFALVVSTMASKRFVAATNLCGNIGFIVFGRIDVFDMMSVMSVVFKMYGLSVIVVVIVNVVVVFFGCVEIFFVARFKNLSVFIGCVIVVIVFIVMSDGNNKNFYVVLIMSGMS